MHFQYSIHYVTCKELYTPDTLSRAPLPNTLECKALEETEMFVEAIIASLPAHNDRLNEYHQNQATDTICSQLITLLPIWLAKSKAKRTDQQVFQQLPQVSLQH